MAKRPIFQVLSYFIFASSIILIEFVIANEEFCTGKNETIDKAMALSFSCHENATDPKVATLMKDCYKKANPEGVPYPADTMDVSQVKEFFCQKNFSEIAKKIEACAGVREETTKEKEEMEKKVNECFENFVRTNMAAEVKMDLSKQYYFRLVLSDKGPKFDYCGTAKATFGGTELIKFSSNYLRPGADSPGTNVMFAKQLTSFDPEKIDKIEVSWNSEKFTIYGRMLCEPNATINEGGAINVVGLEMKPRGMFKGPRQGNDDYTTLKHGETVIFTLA